MARMARMKRIERETVINFNQAQDIAEITTADTVVMRKFDKMMDKDDSIRKEEVSNGYIKYTMPKKFVKFSVARKLTDEQRAEISERAKNMRLKRNY